MFQHCNKMRLILLPVFFITLAVMAQVQNGSVTGTVSDPSGAALPHVEVQALSEATGTRYTATTTLMMPNMAAAQAARWSW